jgi:CheY-like chemotaxis protein
MCEFKDAVVLVIDDCKDNLFLLELILIEDGYEVVKANSGREGIAKIHELAPDLIILDMMMPDINGLEVIEQIKLYSHLSHIPILLCTANTYIQKEDVQQVDNICYKPIDITEIITQVNSLIPCCDSVNIPTVIVDANNDNSLYLEHQQVSF